MPLHSPLLRQSLLVSFPPLIDMLKFSGCSYLIRGQSSEIEKISLSQANYRLGHQSVWQSPITLGTKLRHRHYILSLFIHSKEQNSSTQAVLEDSNDARTGIPSGIPEGAICVQRFDDSRNSAIHITYRISLRSSSMPEPRDPLLKVLKIWSFKLRQQKDNKEFTKTLVNTGQKTSNSPAALQRAHQSNRLKINKGGRVEGHTCLKVTSTAR